MKILLVEDEKALADITKKGMEESGFTVELARDGEEGLFMAENYAVDVIVLDIMLPRLSGFELLGKIREKGIKTPVLLLTARDAVSDKIRGLDSGADDYLTKPFDLGELLARVRVLLRRKFEVKDLVIEIDDMTINTKSH
ncbi:MAG: response regulator, partial [Nitrospinota bacterium]